MEDELELFDVFISHSRSDKNWVNKLKTELEAKGLKVWLDEDEIAPGRRYIPKLEAGIQKSKSVAFVISPSSIDSGWVQEEYNLALRLEKETNKILIPVLLRDAPIPGFLGSRRPVYFKDDTEFELSLNDLYWGITGKNWDDQIRKNQCNSKISKFYSELCQKGNTGLLNKDIIISPYLDHLGADKRLGLTLIARPDQHIVAKLSETINQLKTSCPSLFTYDLFRFHLTLLSLKTATEMLKLDNSQIEDYHRIVNAVLKRHPAFEIVLKGVCATPNSIIAMGTSPTLEMIRESLRKRLQEEGMADDVDVRYRIQGVHMVLARFQANDDFSELYNLLQKLRLTPLGRMTVQYQQLVVNDFYMSPDKVQTLKEYPVSPVHNFLSTLNQFVGRRHECELISKTLTHPNSQVMVLSGFGGVGKSALAIEAVRRCLILGKAHLDFVIWIDLRQYYSRGRDILDTFLNKVALFIDPKSSITAVSDIEEKKTRITQLLRQYRTILILDNYETVLTQVKQDDSMSGFIAEIIARSNYENFVRVLITTRIVSEGLLSLRRQFQYRDIRLKELPYQDAIKLMRDLSSNKIHTLAENEYSTIWRLLHGLPKYMQLAMDQLSFIPFLEWKKTVEKAPSQLGQDKFFGDLFNISWKRILSEDAKKLLMAITYFEGNASFDSLSYVTGISHEKICNAIYETVPAYVERTGNDLYNTHSLTHTYCQTVLKHDNYADFHLYSVKRFIEYFFHLSKQAKVDSDENQLQRELKNIVAAIQLAYEFSEWTLLTKFRETLSGFLRIRGYWPEQRVVMELILVAATTLKDREIQAKCLVDDLAWLHLRFEDLPKAEKYAREGLSLFSQLKDINGQAQALRQLGKSALLKGEYNDSFKSAQKFFDTANNYYSKSLLLRESLHQQKTDQTEKISDMELDFGRLYWLRGRKYELEYHNTHSGNKKLTNKAKQLYLRSIDCSHDALTTFQKINCARGIAKAWGNIANAEKEMARLLIGRGRIDEASDYIKRAHQHYNLSAKYAQDIHRKDEIAHAYWGLAETLEMIEQKERIEGKETRHLLHDALTYADKSYELYATLGGPYDQRTTKALASHLRSLLA